MIEYFLFKAAIALFAGAAAGVAIAMIIEFSYEYFRDWVRANRTPTSATAVAVKQMIAEGKYTIQLGVFDTDGNTTASTTIEAKQLSPEMRTAFDRNGKVVIHV